jgi:uncharacterized protein (TIGR02391 family)
MNPVNFPPPDSDWPKARADLNYAMEFYGYHLDNSGKVLKQAPVKTYDEAVQRHKTLTEKLTPFEIHPTVLKFCKPELLAKNYFHAIFEASKSVFQRIRDLNQSSLDGMQLVNSSFNLKNPSIIINGYTFENNEEKSEYHGLVSIVSSICYIYRNPKAHTLRLYNPSLENDAVTALMLISLAHKLLDRCIVVRYID